MFRRGPSFTARKSYFPPPRKDVGGPSSGEQVDNRIRTTAGVVLQLTNGSALKTTKG